MLWVIRNLARVGSIIKQFLARLQPPSHACKVQAILQQDRHDDTVGHVFSQDGLMIDRSLEDVPPCLARTESPRLLPPQGCVHLASRRQSLQQALL